MKNILYKIIAMLLLACSYSYAVTSITHFTMTPSSPNPGSSISYSAIINYSTSHIDVDGNQFFDWNFDYYLAYYDGSNYNKIANSGTDGVIQSNPFSGSTTLSISKSSFTLPSTLKDQQKIYLIVQDHLNCSPFCPAGFYSSNYFTVVTVASAPISNNVITAPSITSFYISGDPSNIAGNTPSGGTGSYTYQWQSKTTGAYSNISGATNASYDPTTISQTTTYSRIVSSAGVANNTSNEITIAVLQCPPSYNLTGAINSNYRASGTITASNGSIIAGSNVFFRGNLVVVQSPFVASGNSSTYFKATIDPCTAGTRMAFDDGNELGSQVISNSFNIYPNPNDGTFTINFPSSEAIYDVQISDMLGNIVLKENISNTFAKDYSLNNLSNGMYIVNLTGAGVQKRMKVQVIR